MSERATCATIDRRRALSLAKAARGILDEAEMMGLACDVGFDATQKIPKRDDVTHVHIKHNLRVKGMETPPK